jgi:hypothetical protein
MTPLMAAAAAATAARWVNSQRVSPCVSGSRGLGFMVGLVALVWLLSALFRLRSTNLVEQRQPCSDSGSGMTGGSRFRTIHDPGVAAGSVHCEAQLV